MSMPVLMPEIGVPAATVSLWFIDSGDHVEEGERLVEILAGAATFDVPAPVSGTLTRRLALPLDHVLPQQVLGYIDEDELHVETA
ncbi:MAG: biotin attachment protein [Planctomycetes bacterium]|nr:biotin attachment protein [Planctomycetota bacterium]